MSNQVIKIENVSKRYRIGAKQTEETLIQQISKSITQPFRNFKRISSLSKFDNTADPTVFWALQDINFEVEQGEVLGIIGHNGAGKSTLLKILSRITEPTSGKITIKGRVSALLEVGTGFHPELTGRDNIYMNGTILGMRKKEIDLKLDEIIEFSGVSEYIDTPVKFYSSGMRVRLAFSVAAHLEPEILIIDEVLAVGDMDFQKKCLGKMENIAGQGRTVLFVSHTMSAVESLCNSAIMLKNGRTVKSGTSKDVIRYYQEHFYTPTSIGLKNRQDREGIRDFNFSDMLINSEKPVMVGSAFSINLIYVSEQNYEDVHCAITVCDSLGNRITVIDNRSQGIKLDLRKGDGCIKIDIPDLRLIPNRYSLDIWIAKGSLVLDYVTRANVLEVFEGDFSGNGFNLNARQHGYFIPKSSQWSC